MYFKINPRIMEHLGSDLITSDEVAITELIKNSYDAKSKQARIHFFSNIDEVKGKEANIGTVNNEESIDEIKMKPLLTAINDEIFSFIPPEFRNKKVIMIEDIGKGMGLRELEEGFFTIGTDIKKKEKNLEGDYYEKNNRVPLGEKGIGRLAAQRLGELLVIETTSEESPCTYIAVIEWKKLVNNDVALVEIDIPVSTLPKIRNSYTRLWILGSSEYNKDLREYQQLGLFDSIGTHNYNENITDELCTALSFLMSPFHEAKQDFRVILFDKERIEEPYCDSDILKIAETIHSFTLEQNAKEELVLNLRMEITPWYLERVHFGLIDDNELFEQYRQKPSYYNELIIKNSERFNATLCLSFTEKEFVNHFKTGKEKNRNENLSKFFNSLKVLSPIEGKAYTFKRGKPLSISLTSAKNLKLIEEKVEANKVINFIQTYNGIKLYRAGFTLDKDTNKKILGENACRIGTLGNKDSDWIQLQQYRTKGQQYFRLNLANTVGYIKINDLLQNYVREISSRQDLNHSFETIIFKEFIKRIFNHFFFEFNRSSYYISVDIIKETGFLPEDATEELKQTIEQTKQIVSESKANLQKFNDNIQIIKQNIDLDTPGKISNVKNILHTMVDNSEKFNKNMGSTVESIEKTEKLLGKIEEDKVRIEVESYNNYKLMANGLITETITHELHSIIDTKKPDDDAIKHFKEIEDYILDSDNIELFNDHFDPAYRKYLALNTRMKEIAHFYSFLEKTFVHKGTIDELLDEDIKVLLRNLTKRLSYKVDKLDVYIDYSTIDMVWPVPKGVLIHVFYNLFDNSFYWIEERRRRSQDYDHFFKSNSRDVIRVEKQDEDTILFSDTGTGVLKHREYDLFNFLTTGKGEKGRGMGLYIIKKLLLSFNGDIELLPERNQYGNRYIFAIRRIKDDNSEVNIRENLEDSDE